MEKAENADVYTSLLHFCFSQLVLTPAGASVLPLAYPISGSTSLNVCNHPPPPLVVLLLFIFL